MTMPMGLGLGAAASMLITVLIAFVGAAMIFRQVIPEESVGYCSLAALLCGTVTGAMVSAGAIKRRRLVVSLMSGGIYLCILLSCTALFFGGQYEGFGVTFLTVALGSAVAALIQNGAGEKRIRRRCKKR